LEFNCRFGDPEAQAVLPLLEDDLYDVCAGAAAGTLEFNRFEWRPGAAVAVVAASKGYPGAYEKGRVIKGLGEVGAMEDVIVFHAGTATDDDKVVTAGGRVFAVTALGVTVADAIERAYGAMDKIRFVGMHYRRDIGHKAIARSRG
jgi:phosphoribosylamine--glycine ligase